jgi:hypothetical protein
MGYMKNPYKDLVTKPGEKRSLGKHRRRWENNVRMDLGKTGWEGVKWIHLAHNRNH